MGEFINNIQVSCEMELRGDQCGIPDSQKVRAARAALSGYDSYIVLGKALSGQFRYREAAAAFSMATAIRPKELAAIRLRAGGYLSSLQTGKAYTDFSRCLQMGADKLDVEYRLGLCCYFMRNYPEAMRHFEIAMPLTDDEMGIAVIYWHTLCACRHNSEPKFLADYRIGMEVGHHYAYEKAVAVWAGAVLPETAIGALKTEREDLHYGITAYGLSLYLCHIGRTEEGESLMAEHLARDSFWPCYAYLAAWNDNNVNTE